MTLQFYVAMYVAYVHVHTYIHVRNPVHIWQVCSKVDLLIWDCNNYAAT